MYFTMTMQAKAAVMVVAMTMMMIGMTTANKREVRSVRHSRTSLPPCTGGRTVPVKMCVKTSEGTWGFGSRGTDSNVNVRLNGRNCYSPYYNLESPQDDFETGDYDCYEFTTWDVGYPVSSIHVKLDPFDDPWVLSFMAMRYNNARSCVKFYLQQWINNAIPITIANPTSIRCSSGYKLNN